MMKKLSLLLMIFLFLGSMPLHAEEVFSSLQENYSKIFNNVDKKLYAVFYENAEYLLRKDDLYIVRQWRGGRAAYIQASDKFGQLKAYVDMKYKKGILEMAVKVTFDGELAEEAAYSKVQGLGQDILKFTEEYAVLPTVRVRRVVNLRSGPSTKAGKVGTLRSGQILRLVGEDGRWVQVRSLSGDGLQGWVYSSFIKKRYNRDMHVVKNG